MSDPDIHPPLLARPLKVTISYTHTCNLDCAYCYADCGRSNPAHELAARDWIAFIDRAVADGVIAVYFEGGEPLHRGDFLSVVAHAGRRAMTMLRTNGTLVTHEVARALREARLAVLFVDLMGSTPEIHDGLTRRPGSFERTLRGVEAALAAGLETRIVTILNRRNVDDLPGWAALAGRLGVRTVGVLRPYPIGRMRRAWDAFSLPLARQAAAIRSLALPTGMTLMHSWHPNDANCCWQMAAVDALGRSIGCTYLREFVDYGSIRARSLAETWDDPLCRELRGGRVERSCGACNETQGSRGGCRSTAFAFHGRFDAPDPFDEALNDGIDLTRLPDWMLDETTWADHASDPGAAGLPRLSPGRRPDVQA